MEYLMIQFQPELECVIRVNVNRFEIATRTARCLHAQIRRIARKIIFHRDYTNWHQRFAMQFYKNFKYLQMRQSVVRRV